MHEALKKANISATAVTTMRGRASNLSAPNPRISDCPNCIPNIYEYERGVCHCPTCADLRMGEG